MLYSGGEDLLADPVDVKRLLLQLPLSTYWKEIPDYAHLDFGRNKHPILRHLRLTFYSVWALDAPDLIYTEVLKRLKQIYEDRVH